MLKITEKREREECHKMSINCGSLSLPCLLVGKKEHISRFFTSSARNRMKFIWCKKDRYQYCISRSNVFSLHTYNIHTLHKPVVKEVIVQVIEVRMNSEYPTQNFKVLFVKPFFVPCQLSVCVVETHCPYHSHSRAESSLN